MKIVGKKSGSRRYDDSDTIRLMRLVEARRFADVERVAREHLGRNDRNPLALKALSFALIGLMRFEEALAVTEFALRFSSDDGEVHNNRAIALAEMTRWNEALPEFAQALQRLPADFEIHKNFGVALFRLHRWNDAVPYLVKAIELHPDDYVEAIEILVRVLSHARRFEEASPVARSLRDAFPDIPGPLHRLLNVEFSRCNWSGIDGDVAKLRNMLDSQALVAGPWEFFKYWHFGMGEFRRQAEAYASAMIPEHLRQRKAVAPLLTWRPGDRPLRVGYLSADLRDHAVGYAIAELIERHNRAAVTVIAYSLYADDGSEQRKRLVSAFDQFVDVELLSVPALAERIRADSIDVLIDLNGWTGYQRTETLAFRCAPVQVSWLGFAGTLGLVGLADYIIGDSEVTPETDQQYFSEQIVRMPHSFMPVDTRHRVAITPSRTSQGLANEAFVVCSFNSSYKLNPPLFDLWCSFLRQMPDAVLWLAPSDDIVIENLRREAEQRGVAAWRLVFASRVAARADHLARLSLADLALDTFPYNSHATGADALLAGVPMVTKRGDTFPGRVGESMLKAAGLPELIASDDAAYADLVLGLYRDRARLANLRQNLLAGRATAPLFDMDRFACDLEALYFTLAGAEQVRAAETGAEHHQAPTPEV